MKLRAGGAAAVRPETTTAKTVGSSVGSGGGASGLAVRDSEEDERSRPQVMCMRTFASPIGRSTKGDDIVGLSVLTNGQVIFKTTRGSDFVATRKDIDNVGNAGRAMECINGCKKVVMLQKVYGDIDVLASGLMIMKNPGLSMSLFFDNHLAVSLFPRTSATPKNTGLAVRQPDFWALFNCAAWDSWEADKENCMSRFQGHFTPCKTQQQGLLFHFPSIAERDEAIDWFKQHGALIDITHL
ncbi:hypothetical protein Pelo_10081 [Pelomyxa schiedti]|nr:hypothetical protein Pelo_10081 [Pelomyxa schiedti]